MPPPAWRLAALAGLLLLLVPPGSPLAAAAPPQPDTCLDCHRDTPAAREMEASIHAAYGMSCADCHGGDATKATRAEAESKEAGFRGALKNAYDVLAACGPCHDAEHERQEPWRHVLLQRDSVQRYKRGDHGHALLANQNIDAADCADCHRAHGTRRVTDPESLSHPVNMNATCARCHGDRDYISKYNFDSRIPSWVEASVHGTWAASLPQGEAPTCAGCHRGHENRNYKQQKVYDVCGRCHAPERAQFQSGHPHRHDEVNCSICHGSHAIKRPDDAMLGGDGVCVRCHEPQKQPQSAAVRYLVGVQDAAAQVRRRLARTTALLATQRQRGIPSPSLEKSLQRLERRWRQRFGLEQHGLDLRRLRRLGEEMEPGLVNLERLVLARQRLLWWDGVVLVAGALLLAGVGATLAGRGRRQP